MIHIFQVTDFGLHELRYCAENDFIGEHQYFRGNTTAITQPAIISLRPLHTVCTNVNCYT